MKTKLFFFGSLGLLILFLLSFNKIKKPDNLTPLNSDFDGRVVGFRYLKLLPETQPHKLEKFAKEQLTPTFRTKVPGVESYIFKGQRGDNKDGYVHILIFDSERTRDFYFPIEGEGEPGIPEAALKLWRPGQIMLLDSLPKYTQPLTSQAGYTDYIFLE
ncbi:hypothetical protein [Flagellimonas flava]|uniref:Uncharacterized protein n=1 Tax=Flagellimonas flava TaxID=570519 RepID=A0A1M5P7N5_9FLAO|nr:hypothetical protein [Allomuricauda flava]SHG97851.1 hypothetical protein SAMN04488116_3121 [Allomuricauda flava]